MFASAKGKQQKQVLQCQEQCIDHNTFRNCRVNIFPDNLSRNGCISEGVIRLRLIGLS